MSFIKRSQLDLDSVFIKRSVLDRKIVVTPHKNRLKIRYLDSVVHKKVRIRSDRVHKNIRHKKVTISVVYKKVTSFIKRSQFLDIIVII